MMSNNRKYIFVNDMPVLNPEFQNNESDGQPVPSAPPADPEVLPVVSNMADQAAISQVTNLNVPHTFQETINTMRSDEYLAKFHASGLSGDALINGLNKVFSQNEIPIGLMSKLTPLQDAILHFKIDDSESMNESSNLQLKAACEYTKQQLRARGVQENAQLSRWQEAEDRMHTLIELLAYVPTGPIILSLFDDQDRYNHNIVHRGARIVLDRTGKLPEIFLHDAHSAIRNLFNKKPVGRTPILMNMEHMLEEASQARLDTGRKTIHYLLSDGEPNGGKKEIAKIKDLLNPKLEDGSELPTIIRDAEANPFTFLGCSDKEVDYAWMHELEEIASFVAAISAFDAIYEEVVERHGGAFPYTRGFWLLCNVCASMNPDDLGTLVKHVPFTKPTLENMLGRGMTEGEYRKYFTKHSIAVEAFDPDYQLFLTTPVAKDIPSAKLLIDTMAEEMDEDIDHGDADTHKEEARHAVEVVINSRKGGNTAPVIAAHGGHGERAERTPQAEHRNNFGLYRQPPAPLREDERHNEHNNRRRAHKTPCNIL